MADISPIEYLSEQIDVLANKLEELGTKSVELAEIEGYLAQAQTNRTMSTQELARAQDMLAASSEGEAREAATDRMNNAVEAHNKTSAAISNLKQRKQELNATLRKGTGEYAELTKALKAHNGAVRIAMSGWQKAATVMGISGLTLHKIRDSVLKFNADSHQLSRT